eukprot:g15612.t1
MLNEPRHAVSRDKNAWPDPCLYCQLREEEDENDEEEVSVPELRFVPAEPSHLQEMFKVFSEMSALNPDPYDEQADDSESEGDFEDVLVCVQECPLGLLNLAIVHFYTAAFESTEESTDPLVSERHRKEVMQISAHVADSLASEFPVHVICSSRWPVFEAIEIFTLKMDKDVQASRVELKYLLEDIAGVPGNACDDIVETPVDRRSLVADAVYRRISQSRGPADLLVALLKSGIAQVVKLLLLIDNFVDKASTKQAELECPIGTAFLAAVQAASAVVQFTHNFDKHSNVLDKVIHEGLLSAVSCGWPLGHALAVLSDSNKARRYADRNYKYLRNYADLDLHALQSMNLKMFRSNEMSDLKSPWHSYLAGFSMVINQADRHHKVLFDLCKVVYLTPPGSQAVRVHTDDQDVILLQVWGSKHWTLYNAPTHLPYTEENAASGQVTESY